jgi:hypothetical protein
MSSYYSRICTSYWDDELPIQGAECMDGFNVPMLHDSQSSLDWTTLTNEWDTAQPQQLTDIVSSPNQFWKNEILRTDQSPGYATNSTEEAAIIELRDR